MDSGPDGRDAAAPEAEAGPPLPTADEALDWLQRIKPGAVLALLKDPEFGSISRAFLGFRADAKGYTNPLVRSRLAQAAAKDAKLAEKLRGLLETEAKAGPPPMSASPAPASRTASPAKADPLPAVRAERDARRRERDEARSALTAAAAGRDAALKARELADAERDEAARLAKKQAERIGRLERQVAQLRLAETRLLKALGEDKVSPPPALRARNAGAPPPEVPPEVSPWPDAVRHLLDRGKFDAALSLAEDVLKAEPEDAEALNIAVRAWEGRHEPRSGVPPCRRLLGLQVRRGDMAAGAETLLVLFRLVASPGQAEAEVRLFLSALAPSDARAVEAARRMLSRLRGANPAAHGWLASYVAARTVLGPVLMPPPGALGPDDPLPLRLKAGRPVTARLLAEAVDHGDLSLVEAARAVLLPLEAADAGTHGRIWAALEQAASDDPARLSPLRRAPRGAAVVDGSNVAWFDQESLVHGRPRLRHLLGMRRALWARGFFPVVLYADANLPYFVDESAGLLQMRDRRELTLVDAGIVADEVLLRVAKQMRAPLITNDRMEDWDPKGEVRKVRFTISLTGEAHLLSEI